MMSRRRLLQAGAFMAATPLVDFTGKPLGPSPARAEGAASTPEWRHALSLFGDVKYPADFKRFDYVNPDAPKTGTLRLVEIGTFDNFNPVIAGLKGSIAGAVDLIYESLTTRSLDEISTAYGLLA
jgi:microcin C transport system substrate-binding protein